MYFQVDNFNDYYKNSETGGNPPQPGQIPAAPDLNKPRGKRIGTGGIIAIILTSCFALLILGSAAVAGVLMFDPDSSISVYSSANSSESSTQAQTDKDTSDSSLGDITIGSDGNTLSTDEIFAQTAPSVVGVVVQTAEGEGVGSGVIMNKEGYILTNAHVVEGETSIQVNLYSGDTYSATVIGSDEVSDIAVIKIEASGLTAAVFGDSDTVTVGEKAVAIGNPLGLELSFSVTEGIVSALNRNITIENYSMTLIQTDAAINPGNSGGPLINSSGEIIGITSAKIMSSYSSTNVEGIGFAIPINNALTIAKDLVTNGHVTGRPYLGITVQTESSPSGQAYVNYIYVAEVTAGSPADKAGIAAGDVITKFNGVEVATTAELITERDKYSPGDVVSVTVTRNSKSIELSMTLGEIPD